MMDSHQGVSSLRGFISKLLLSLLCLALASVQALPLHTGNGDVGVSFINVAKQAGLTTPTVYGDEHKNKYLLETTGCGAAFLDYDNDDWQDILLVNGTRLEGLPQSQTPTCRPYHNQGDGRITEETTNSGLTNAG